VFEWIFDFPGIVAVGVVAWLALRLSRVLRARDVDYSRAMAIDMARRERQAAERRGEL
jgi:hypothetical protein